MKQARLAGFLPSNTGYTRFPRHPITQNATQTHVVARFSLLYSAAYSPHYSELNYSSKTTQTSIKYSSRGLNMANFKVNGVQQNLDIEPDMPLLWVIRDELGMTGTKFGCGIASCGACTVHVNGMAVRSCVTPVSSVEGQEVTTIEGLASVAAGANPSAPDLSAVPLSAVQQAWIDHQVPQCGYCQSGMIMAVSSMLAANPNPSDADIDSSITNVCRCGSYPRVRKAIRSLAIA